MNVYDQFLSQFRAPSLMLRSNYFDYKAAPSPYFDADRAFFVIHPQRQSFIRPAFCGELDYTPDDQPFSELLPKALCLKTLEMPDDLIRRIWPFIPRLHVLVSRISPTVHNVTALFRGRAWWKYREEEGRSVDSLRSDEELTPVLRRISDVEGFDVAAWRAFEAELIALTNNLPDPRSKATRVH